jgi:hypothetical protein
MGYVNKNSETFVFLWLTMEVPCKKVKFCIEVEGDRFHVCQ